jgi:metal-dependent hydrolase (beta-lactamase superfamily II)
VSVDNACAVRNVPYYFLSHFHTDHLKGLKDGADIYFIQLMQNVHELSDLVYLFLLNILVEQDGRMARCFVHE